MVQPEDVETYLGIKSLLLELQRELDEVWAVLGEIYGRFREFAGLGLTVRRVRSTLDEPAEDSSPLAYYPIGASITAAGRELLPLLIQPLYGDRPEIAIRELVQNAVDACRELEDLRTSGRTRSESRASQNSPHVVVELERIADGTGRLTITDAGIGMTADTVQNYFLRAGASFRDSDAWRRLHTDESNQSRVLRSGRFGIGVLAGFLLGDEIDVVTRHANASPDEGVHFRCRLDEEMIELRRVPADRGTQIRIRIDRKDTVEKLCGSRALYRSGPTTWDWYCLEYPKVVRVMQPPVSQLAQRAHLPGATEELPAGWYRIRHDAYSDIQWSYARLQIREYWQPRGTLVCNGLVVGPFSQWAGYRALASHLFLRPPNLNVFDPDGRLPLDLRRTGLAAPLPFEKELLEDICRDFLAYLLVTLPAGGVDPSTNRPASTSVRPYVGLWRGPDELGPWLWNTPRGWALLDGWHLIQESPQTLLVDPNPVYSEVGVWTIPSLNWANRHYVRLPQASRTKENRTMLLRCLAGLSSDLLGAAAFTPLRRVGCRIVISKVALAELREYKGIPRKLASELHSGIEWADNRLAAISLGQCPKLGFSPSEVAAAAEGFSFVLFAEMYFASVSPEEKEVSTLAAAWKRYLGQAVIPYAKEERLSAFQLARSELRDYIAVHEGRSGGAAS